MAPSYHSESEDHQESLDFSGIEYQGIFQMELFDG